MRKLTTTILAALAAVCVFTAALQCAIAESEDPMATGAALVVVEVDAVEPQGGAVPEIKVSYRQIRVLRILGKRYAAVGYDPDWKEKSVQDFETALETIAQGGRDAVLIIPRHDPELTHVGDSAEGFFRDCLVFEVGGETASVYLSGPPRGSSEYRPPGSGILFSAVFPPSDVNIYRRRKYGKRYERLIRHVGRTCPDDRIPSEDNLLALSGVTFRLHVEMVNAKVKDVNPSELRGQFTVVDVRPVNGGLSSDLAGVLDEVCEASQSSTLEFFVCRKPLLEVFDTDSATGSAANSRALLRPNRELAAIVQRESSGELYRLQQDGGLKQRTLSGELGERLTPGDRVLQMEAEGGPVSLPIHGSRDALNVSLPAWARAEDVVVTTSKRLRPFGVRMTDKSHDSFDVAVSEGGPNLSIIPSGVAEPGKILAQASTELLDWAFGERAEIKVHLPFSKPHSLAPRLSGDGEEILLDLSGVRWNLVNLKARVSPSGAPVSTRGWKLSRGGEEIPFPEGFAPSWRVAKLLGGEEKASVAVNPAGKQFAGYRAGSLELSLDDLEEERLLTLHAVAKPVKLPLTPGLLAGGAAPAVRIRRVDGTWVDVLGQVDRFGGEAWKIVNFDGTILYANEKDEPFNVEAPHIASIQPMGLIGSGPREMTPSVLEDFIKAVRATDARTQCELLRKIMFGPGERGVIARAATPDTVVVAKRQASSGETELATLADSSLSTRFRVLSGWAPHGVELRSNGDWIKADEDQCHEFAAGLSRTLYLVVVVDQFAAGSVGTISGPATGRGSDEDDLFGSLDQSDSGQPGHRGDRGFVGDPTRATLEELTEEWSPIANDLRNLLTRAGFGTVIMVAAEVKNGRRGFSVPKQVDKIASGKSRVPFSGLLSGLVDGSIRPGPLRLDEHPRQLRMAFEAEFAGSLVPNSRLIVLNRPRTGGPGDGRVTVSVFDEPAPLRMRSIDGFLNPGGVSERRNR